MNQDLKKTLWAAADKLRSSMDAAEYKHIVLGLIFLKYISDAFDERREELAVAFEDEAHELYLPDPEDRALSTEERDYYTMVNCFWVPGPARWETIRANAKQADIGTRIDLALDAIEADNPRLKGILDKRFGRAQLEPGKLGELIDLISTIGFGGGSSARDLLGEVYEYFLGQFASAEGKKGGQFYTPASVVKVLVEVLAPHKGKVYDPCCGSGGMFVQSEKFIESHGGKFGDISIYGQEANPTTWRLVAMNLAIRGMDFNLGKEPADTFHRDQHPDLKADYVLANPPFNISDWGGDRLLDDKRWVHGTPPAGNANYAWLQHILHHLGPRGQAGVVLANGSMSSNQNSEGEIRRAMVEADVVEVMVALPPQLFFNTQIPACLWFLAKDKTKGGRDRRGEVLFIDARKLGRMDTRVTRVFDDEDVRRIATTVHQWRQSGEAGTDEPYADVPGFCRAVKLAEIAEHGHVLTPGRYVGAEATDDDDEAFNEKMERLTAQLAEQMAKGIELDAVIREKLEDLVMESDWQRTTVGAVSLVVTKGTTPTTLGHAFQEAGINFVKVESISPDGRFQTDKLVRISKEAHEALARSQLAPNDVLFTIAGTIGRTAIVTTDILPANTNQAVAIVRPNTALVRPRFLRYVLNNPAFLTGALSRTVESVQANFSLGELKSASILLPDLREQERFVEVLGAIDDRIDLLRQTNATLESIAQALFKSWFIDFDPVRAKAEGREPEGMDAATAALFPAEFEESALGMIPKGWSAIPFAETVSIMGGGTPKTSVPEFWGGDIPWFSVVDAPGAGQVFTMRTEKSITSAGVDNSSTRVLPAWTTIISARGTVGKLAMTARPMAMNQSCYGLGPRVPGTEPLVYLAAQRLVDDLKRLAHGGVFDTITRDTLSSVSIVQAPPDVQSALAAMVKPVFEKIQQGVERISVLTELRDTLLPRLISGKLRLPEAKERLQDALA